MKMYIIIVVGLTVFINDIPDIFFVSDKFTAFKVILFVSLVIRKHKSEPYLFIWNKYETAHKSMFSQWLFDNL